MEPNDRNRVVCPICGRKKLLFETEKKALRYLEFNGEAIQREGETLRAYYCEGCGGWHITSKPYKPSYDNMAQNLIDAYEKGIKKVKYHSGGTN